MNDSYKSGSLSLTATVAMGTGVMIGAGIFALTGQVAEYAGSLFPFAFLLAAVISGFSAYTYIKVTSKYPSASGVAMILEKAYGHTVMTGASALLMVSSMIINESLVARTFGSYTLQLFDVDNPALLTPILAVGLILSAFLINLTGNKLIGAISKITAVIKIGGILAFAGVGTFVADSRPHSDVLKVRNIADEIRIRRHAYTADVLKLEEVVAKRRLNYLRYAA
jgi:amino acid transporter